MADFKKAFEYVLGNEGEEFTDHPLDSGGPTKFGITQATLQSWRMPKLGDQVESAKVVTIEDVRNMTRAEAELIYQVRYWDAISCGKMTDENIALAIFDVAVNMGVVQAAKFAQEAVRVKVDGKIGPITLFALNQVPRKFFLAGFIAAVQDYYVKLVVAKPEKIVFLNGWLNRSQKLITLI